MPHHTGSNDDVRFAGPDALVFVFLPLPLEADFALRLDLLACLDFVAAPLALASAAPTDSPAPFNGKWGDLVPADRAERRSCDVGASIAILVHLKMGR